MIKILWIKVTWTPIYKVAGCYISIVNLYPPYQSLN